MVFRELDTVAVKGKTQSVKIYEPICEKGDLTQEQEEKLELHKNALACWYNQDIDQAKQKFSKLALRYPDDKYYDYMVSLTTATAE